MSYSMPALYMFCVMLAVGLSGCDKTRPSEVTIPGSRNHATYQDNRARWSSFWSTKRTRAEAAQAILESFEQDQGEPPTMSRLISVLGTPSRIEGYAYNTIEPYCDPDSRSLALVYTNGVQIGVSVTGYACSVSYPTGPSMFHIERVPYWKQTAPAREGQPVVFPREGQPARVRDLLEVSTAFGAGKTESEWCDILLDSSMSPDDANAPSSPCEVRIMLAEEIAPGVAKVHYRIQGKRIVYCGTWWEYSEGRWWLIHWGRAAELLKKAWAKSAEENG